jgi:hypothetical protein
MLEISRSFQYPDGYIHHIPGRLRLRSELVKRNDARAAEAVAFLRSIAGVHSAAANPLTGSLTIHYNTALTTGDALYKALKEAGWLTPRQTLLPPPPPAPVLGGSAVGVKIAKKLTLFALEQAAERSLAALIAAIL